MHLLLQVISQQLHVLHELQVLHPLYAILLAPLGRLLVFDDAHLQRVSTISVCITEKRLVFVDVKGEGRRDVDGSA
jgi:hypothetical protein